jgi:DUF4097 and DUF4098 domain-containing protein YvlB
MSEPRSYYHPRSIFGPILIVGIGTLFLLKNFGVLSGRSIGWWFSQYWPLVLILWGVVKLLEYLWAKQHDRPAPGLGAGGIVFLVFLVLFGMVASKAAGTDWARVGDAMDIDTSDDFGFGIFGNQYQFTNNFSQAVAGSGQVKIISARGNITVSASQDDQAHVLVHKYVRSNSQEEANGKDTSTQPKFEQQGNVLVLEMVGGNFESVRCDIDLQLPVKNALSVSTRRGDIRVSSREGNIDLDSTHGDINAEDIKGDASLRLRHGDLSVKNVTGNVTVDGTVSDSTVSDVGGTLTFTGSYTGDIRLSHISHPVHFSSVRTDLQLARLNGDLSMDRSDFKANDIAGPFRLSTEVKDIHLEDVAGDIHIQDTRGDIEVSAKDPLGSVDIANTSGEISVSLPEKANFQVDAESDGGEIHSDFNNINVNNNQHNAVASGTVGKGGPQVRLKTTNRGTIQIKKG